MLFSYKKQIFLYTLLKEPHYYKLVPPRAYCLLHACHTFCDVLLFVQIYLSM